VDQDTGKASVNDIKRLFDFLSSYSPYALPAADINVLGGLKSSLDDGCVAVNDSTHIGQVVGYKQLKETVTMLQSLEAAFASLKDQVLGANLNWLPKASLTELVFDEV
jgi:hypothetical protein